MRDALFRPESPPNEEVVEEECVAVDVADVKATPFFSKVGQNTNKILIKGGNVVNDDEILEGHDVYVEDGIIKEIGKDLEPISQAVTIDAKGKLVMPGGIDSSTCLGEARGQNVERADDMMSGTKAALAGGTTTVVDVVLAGEGSLKEALERRKAEVEEEACCDVAFNIGITKWNDEIKDELSELAKVEGVTWFKVFFCGEDRMLESNDTVLEVMEAVKEVGGVLVVHAENGLIIKENEKRLLARGIKGPEGHLMARPEEVEEESVMRACAMAAQVNVPLIVSGCTSKAAAAVLAKAKGQGQPVWGEPPVAALIRDGSHYYNECWTHSAGFVSSPPLRDDPDTPDNLVQALSEGAFQLVGSHHATYDSEVKEREGRDNFTKIPHGFNGVEERMSVIWEKAIEGKQMDHQRFVAVTSSNAAKALNIYPR